MLLGYDYGVLSSYLFRVVYLLDLISYMVGVLVVVYCKMEMVYLGLV